MMVNSTMEYSCFDHSGLSYNSVTPDYWVSSGKAYEHLALTSAIGNLFFMIVGIPCNLLIIVSILWQHLYKSPTYVLLLNLAVVDLCLCVFIMPFAVISGIAGEFIFGGSDIVRCRVCQLAVLLTLFSLLTLHLLAFLSLDRWIFIKYAFKYHRIATSKRYLALCIVLWIVCLALSLLPLLGFGDIMLGLHISTCGIKFYDETEVTQNINYAILIGVEMQ